MTDVIDAPTERVNSAHLLDVVSASPSTDGQSVGIVFLVADGGMDNPPRKFMVTYAADKARLLSAVLNDMATKIEKQGALQSATTLMHFPLGFVVGDDPNLDARSFVLQNGKITIPAGAKTVVTFDPGSESEYHAVMVSGMAIALADGIRQHTTPRLTQQDREQLKLIRPGQQKQQLILPG